MPSVVPPRAAGPDTGAVAPADGAGPSFNEWVRNDSITGSPATLTGTAVTAAAAAGDTAPPLLDPTSLLRHAWTIERGGSDGGEAMATSPSCCTPTTPAM